MGTGSAREETARARRREGCHGTRERHTPRRRKEQKVM
jgi:hypothetical protein